MSDREIKGLKELRNKLLALGALAGLKDMAAAGRFAMKPVLADAKRLVPKNTELLEKTLRLATVKPKSGSIVCSVGIALKGKVTDEVPVSLDETDEIVEGLTIASTVKSAAWRWHFVEFGVPAHGIAAKPFLRPAFHMNVDIAIDRLKAKLRQKIQKAAQAGGGSVSIE